jgi:MYXO-CTERM domain-containing protein
MDVGALLEKHRKITRLYTTMSPGEMTKDPTFEFNPDLGDVSNIHTAVFKMNDPDECSNGEWTATLENGTEVRGKGNVWPHRLGDTKLSANARILQFSTSGNPEIIADMSEENGTVHQDSDAGSSPKKKGGCAVSPAPATGSLSWFAGLAGVLTAMAARRHRRRA